MNIVSREHPLSHYQWGEFCDGWNLVEGEGLSIKLEKMPPGTAEQMHYHQHAQQFFFILVGEAVFELWMERKRVMAGEGIHIQAGQPHRIINEGNGDLEFLLASQPTSAGDRINCEKGL